MDFLIATHNMKKRDELQRILSPLGLNIYTADEKGIELEDVEETGTSFEENAILKARSACKDSNMPCIADDSGLVVDALGGRPGVYSARYGGEDMPYHEKMQKLLGELEGVPKEKRTARFVSVVCCALPSGEELIVKGICEGEIGFEISGSGGFGFDPCFYVDGISFANRSDKEKDEISHRANALRALVKELPSFLEKYKKA